MKKIKGFNDYLIDELAVVTSLRMNQPIKKAIRIHNGYCFVKLQYDIGKGKYFALHRLVAETFIPNPENKREVNHINGIKTDNRVENLEWVTPKENTQHSIKLGLTKHRGEDNKRAILTNEDVKKIRLDTRSQRKIAKDYNISSSVIHGIKKGKRWAHVS